MRYQKLSELCLSQAENLYALWRLERIPHRPRRLAAGI